MYKQKGLTNIENRLVIAKTGEGRKDREFGISKCSIYWMYMVYIGWRNNKVLLYNSGNYIQHPVIN